MFNISTFSLQILLNLLNRILRPDITLSSHKMSHLVSRCFSDRHTARSPIECAARAARREEESAVPAPTPVICVRNLRDRALGFHVQLGADWFQP